ncbi:MAG: transglutaminase domain-containing protein [Bacteroidales bacterium]|nr:transglutaminase domain-containing protein [Bacteroidales bacterium]
MEFEKKFQITKKIACARHDELFGVFEQKLKPEEEKALKFLYAYMPLSDLAEYDGDFFLKHVKSALKAKGEISWGSEMPEKIFYHFVLPQRINNENLDSFRTVYYDELKKRIEGLEMYEAALEINHWCHEKVEYQPADIRTSSPMATVKTAFGRCGEESTLAVAALRTVCIPARQVYTPRWAHSDDNHAWVEVWINGTWYFLGACEPEPVLNLGWFNEPASRAMLIHARVFGEYSGSEEINSINTQFTNINVTNRYAETFKQTIKVVDKNGKPVQGANVEFQIYNYAEFYPLAVKKTDKNGECYLTTGLGDLIVWANTEKDYGYKKITVGKNEIVSLELSGINESFEQLEFMPPAASQYVKLTVSEEQKEKNKTRLQYEDSVRNAYVDKFLKEFDFREVAAKGSLPLDWYKYIEKSRGNSNQILRFMLAHRGNAKIWVEPLLSVISDKDLRDTRTEILNNHLENSLIWANRYDKETFVNFVLSPRIANEMLVAYRGFLIESFGEEFAQKSREDINHLIKYVKGNIEINNDFQQYSLPITPIGVYNLKVSDSFSRDIFFVAVCRSFGIPARLEPGTSVPQYKDKDQWIDVWLDEQPPVIQKVKIEFKTNQKNLNFVPQYFHHFSLAQFTGNNFKTLQLEYYKDINKLGKIELKPGKYRLITSNRLETGKILVNMEFFDISADTLIYIEIPLEESVLEYGSIDLQGKVIDENSNEIALKEIIGSGKTVIVMIDPGTEPGKHLLNDFNLNKEKLEKTGAKFVFILPEKMMAEDLKQNKYNLPANTKTVIALPKTLESLTLGENTVKNPVLPLVIIQQSDNTVIYRSSGYAIGRGNSILRKL